MTAQLKTISMQLGTMHMNATLMDALRKATKTMKKVGEDLDMKELTKTLKEYQKESMKMEAKSDMVRLSDISRWPMSWMMETEILMMKSTTNTVKFWLRLVWSTLAPNQPFLWQNHHGPQLCQPKKPRMLTSMTLRVASRTSDELYQILLKF